MRFHLIDRILSCKPGESLTAVKNVALSEEYLADHFPAFPVLPGVFMLEAMTQAGAWLVRISNDFTHSMVTLASAKSVKYANFVPPGSSLSIAVQWSKAEDDLVHLKGQGTIGDQPAVSARLVLKSANLADENPAMGSVDQQIIQQMRLQHALLQVPESGT